MNRSVVIAITLSIVVILWLMSGAIGNDDAPQQNPNAEQTNTDADTPKESLFKVTVKPMTAISIDETITLQGDLKPARAITVKAETNGRITSIRVDKGQRVHTDDSMIVIATDGRQARLEQAQAELKLREAELEAGKQLKAKRLISGNQLEQAIANVATAKASVKQIKVELSQTNIRAAFDGIANERYVELGDYVAAGDPVIELIDDTHAKIAARVPQQHIAKLALGQNITAELIDGTSVTGSVNFISNSAEAATRTFSVEATAQTSSALRLGQSARVKLTVGQVKSHKVSASILGLAANGDIYIVAVDDNNKVVRYNAEIIKNDSDGVWLSGLPETFRLITVGHAFVAEGQTVAVSQEGDA